MSDTVEVVRRSNCHLTGCTKHVCAHCAQEPHAGRVLFVVEVTPSSRHQKVYREFRCGDHVHGGTPLAHQKLPALPTYENGHAWQTPAYDGVGKL